MQALLVRSTDCQAKTHSALKARVLLGFGSRSGVYPDKLCILQVSWFNNAMATPLQKTRRVGMCLPILSLSTGGAASVSEPAARTGSSKVGKGTEGLFSSGGACAFSEARSAALGALKALGRCHAAPAVALDLQGSSSTLAQPSHAAAGHMSNLVYSKCRQLLRWSREPWEPQQAVRGLWLFTKQGLI